MVNIHDVVRTGNESDERFKRWVQDTHDINEKDEEGQTPLHIAAFENFEKIVKILLKKGASCNAIDNKGWTPLHCAASACNFQICQLMLTQAKLNVNILTKSGASALSYLCRTFNDEINQVKTMKMILKEGGEIDSVNQFGETALHQAALKGSFGAIKCLIESGANPNIQTTTEKESPIHFAVRAKRSDVIEYLVRNGAEINSVDAEGKTILDKAIESNQPDLESTIQRLKREQVPWREIKPSGKWPIPRCNQSSSVYNNRWYMYGGCDNFRNPNTIFADLFMMNGNTLEWRALKPKGDAPPPLHSHSSVVIGKNLYIFGGCDAEKTFNDIRVLDIELMTWTSLNPVGPYVIRPRCGHSMTAISESVFVVFGGRSGSDFFSDVHTFSLETNTWERITTNNQECAPSKRWYHSTSLIGNSLYVFGGTDGQTYFSDIHILDLQSWEWYTPAITGVIPYERSGHSAIVINESIILIYGGEDSDGEIMNDIYAFDTESFAWVEYDISLSNHRIDRAGHKMEIVNFGLYTYGGNSLFVLHELLPHILETQAKEISKSVTQKRKQISKPPLPNRPASKPKMLSNSAENPNLSVDQLVSEVKLLITAIKDQYSPDPNSTVGVRIGVIEQLIINGQIPLSSSGSAPIPPQKPSKPQLPTKPIDPEPEIDINIPVKPEKPTMPLKLGGKRINQSPRSMTLPSLAPTPPSPTTISPGRPSLPPKPVSASPPPTAQPIPPPKPSSKTSLLELTEEDPSLRRPRSLSNQAHQSMIYKKSETELLSPKENSKGNNSNFTTLRMPTRDISNPRAPSLVIKKDVEYDDLMSSNPQPLNSASPALKANDRSSKRESIRPTVEKYVLPPRPENPMQYYQKLVTRIPKRDPMDISEIKDKKQRFRAEVFNELIDTELAYLKDLSVLIGLYKKPLENEYLGCITQNYMQTLFLNVEDLFEINLQLYIEFLKIEKLPPAQQNIGIAFLSLIDGLSKYSLYCSNQVEAIETTKRLEKTNEPFVEILTLVKALAESGRQDFHSLSIKPFQRVTRYPLLIKELLNCSPKGSPEAACLTEAKQQIDEIVQAANENKRVIDSVLKMMEIQNSFMWQGEEGQIKWSPDCKYLTEAPFKEYDTKSNKVAKRHFFLFTDMVVIAKPVKSLVPGQTQYKKHTVIPIDSCIIWDTKIDSKHAKYAFTLVRTDNTDKLVVVAPSEMEKMNWMNAINDAISKFMAEAVPKLKGL